MTDFLNEYSGWLGLVALIASIPLGILANIATNKLQPWLSWRSTRTRRKRITYLNVLLEQTDRMMSDPTTAVARFALGLLFAVTGLVTIFGIAFLCGLAGILMYLNPEAAWILHGWRAFRHSVFFFPVTLTLWFIIVADNLRPGFELTIMALRVLHYEYWRKATAADIDRLEHSLARRPDGAVEPTKGPDA